MKAYIACMNHETNSFSPMPTNIQTFRNDFYYNPDDRKGIEVVPQMMGIRGYCEQFAALGYAVQIGPVAFASPGGPVVKKDYEQMRDHILSDLKKAGQVDVVALFLHGAQFAGGYPDCESDLVHRVREIVGAEVPVGVLLDLHCDCTDQMLEEAIVVCCREYPHIDFDERAAEIAVLLDRDRKREIMPVTVKRYIPMIGFFHTTTEPMKGLVASLPDLINEDILAISLMHGFPWSDQPTAGAYVVVVTDNAVNKGQLIAEQLAQQWIPLRGMSVGKYMSISTAIESAIKVGKGPVVIADAADNPGGGAAADSTFILEEILNRNIKNVGFAIIWDPTAVEIAKAAGHGATIDIRIGGKVSPYSGKPVDLTATVGIIFEQQNPVDSCRLETDIALDVDGVHIVITNRRQQVFSPEVFSRVGIDPQAMDILVVKSSQHFQARFEPIAAKIIYCDTAGTLNSNLAAMPFKRIPRPIWPMDQLADRQM